jgi:hypothetical protein
MHCVYGQLLAIKKGPAGGHMAVVRQAFVGFNLLVASTVFAQAADPINLRVADSFPKGHFLVKLILEPWMEEVRKRSNGAVTF